ncbi:ATP citrate synthase [Candidatus Micrarchaeota archaeon]|nr:ATP citrate synthase [Candidatus Micrarchaeota archaeon]MBU1682243.1 ATP citrate synthase [Candidatus Micrarchaeota archaeon]
MKFTKDTRALIYNFKANPVQRMLDFDYICKREKPSIAGLITPGSTGLHKAFFGGVEILLPIYPSIEEACKDQTDADVLINFASFRSAYDSSKKALEQDTINTVVIIAEGIPERMARELIDYSKKRNKMIIGPATVGGIQAGAFKIGNTAGTVDNIIACKLHRPGSVGFVSKSGGLSNEMYNMLAMTTDGLFEGIAVGGDAYPGSTLLEHALRFEQMPEVKMIVMLGELGGKDEYTIVEAKKQGKLKKPMVAWVTGTCAKVFPSDVQFGHAGAKSGAELETAEAKNKALAEAGIAVPNSFEDLDKKIAEVYQELVKDGTISPAKEVEPPMLPMDYKAAVSAGIVRKPSNFVCTISDDRGEEVTYGGVPISEIIENDSGIGDVISLLWFKKKIPRYGSKFIELVLIIAAEHGPCVSGAHNAIVASRAGKDLVSSVASGLLTIGPRFGGAIDDAARYFKDACDRGLSADEFVAEMKNKNKRIPGIGHRIKSAKNPDKRVELLKDYAKKNFPETKYLDFALSVEAETLKKANNLILNVDGCIGILFLDMMSSCECFSKKDTDEIVEIGYLNGLFVLARSIGLIGHVLDQKRLKAPLYRHPWDDVLFLNEE